MEQYLFVIDYQNDFVDGALGFPGAEQLDEGIAEKIRSYAPGHVIFTRDTHQENYLETREGKLLPVKHCVQGSHGWALYGKTAQALAVSIITGIPFQGPPARIFLRICRPSSSGSMMSSLRAWM